MRRLAPLALLLFALPAAAQSVDASLVPDDAPEWKAMETAIEDAQTSGKTLVLHGYAAWCGWCARLDQDVYTDDTVQAYFAEHFEGVRVDIESAETVEFYDYRLPTGWLASGIGITSTPTTVFVDGETGQLITRLPGYADAETFLLALRFVHEKAYETMSFQAFRDANAEEHDHDHDHEAAPMLPAPPQG